MNAPDAVPRFADISKALLFTGRSASLAQPGMRSARLKGPAHSGSSAIAISPDDGWIDTTRSVAAPPVTGTLVAERGTPGTLEQTGFTDMEPLPIPAPEANPCKEPQSPACYPGSRQRSPPGGG